MRSLILGGILLFILCGGGIYATADLQVRFLDVNEGDAVLVQDEGKTILIDAGTSDSGNLTKEYLRSINVTSLDMVLITSPMEGRTGGLTNILNATPAREIIDGGWNITPGPYQDIINKSVEDQIPNRTVYAGDIIDLTPLTRIEILSPDTLSGDPAADVLIPYIIHGNISFLLMGTEQTVPVPVQADIIRVADHGSRQGTDPGFIREVQPKLAIVSTGVGNPSGNPVSTTLNTLQTAGAEVLRTDIDGTITVTTDGSSFSVSKLRMEPQITLSLVSVVETRAPR